MGNAEPIESSRVGEDIVMTVEQVAVNRWDFSLYRTVDGLHVIKVMFSEGDYRTDVGRFFLLGTAVDPSYPLDELTAVAATIRADYPATSHPELGKADLRIVDVSNALVLYLKHYPGRNDREFDATYGIHARRIVRAILDEAIRVDPDWARMDLNAAGNYVQAVMKARHPGLTTKALDCLGNYYTYLMR